MAIRVKAELAQKTKRLNGIKIALVAVVSVIGLMLAAISVMNGSYLFAAAYLIAGMLGVMYAVIKINSTFPPLVTSDGDKLYIRMWDNGFFPYIIDFRPKFFADFMPAKTVTTEIPLSEIADLAIGTMGFLLRTYNNYDLDRKLNQIAAESRRLEAIMKRCDILYIRLKDDRVFAVSVTGFDVDELFYLVDMIEHNASGLEFKTNMRLLRRKRETINGRQKI